MPGVHWSPSPEDLARLRSAVEQAELRTSGEIRVHLEAHCREDVLDHAAFIFHKLRMDKTAQLKGVLLYLALKDRKFAVLGDVGIHQVVGADFWDKIYHEGIGCFQKGDFLLGLESAIRVCGQALEAHFPAAEGQGNELTDEVSWEG